MVQLIPLLVLTPLYNHCWNPSPQEIESGSAIVGYPINSWASEANVRIYLHGNINNWVWVFSSVSSTKIKKY